MTNRIIRIRIRKPRKPQYNETLSKSIDKVLLLNPIAKLHNELGCQLEALDSQYSKKETLFFEYDQEWRALYSKRGDLHQKYYQILREVYPEITLELLMLRSNVGGFLIKLDTMP